jgi:hypothetical protein
MEALIDFIKENSVAILTIVFIMLILLVIISIKGIELNAPKPESKLVQQVVVETLDTMGKNLELGLDKDLNGLNLDGLKLQSSESFCDSYLGNSGQLEQACNSLTKDNCNETKCCVYANAGSVGKCMAGDINGATYKTDKDGQLITVDSYYYLGKRVR